MLKISEEQIMNLLEKQDGNHSEVYRLIKDRLSDYREEEIAFAGEFLFFEERYLLILKHIKENQLPVKKVIDIGCQFGFQSELFEGVEYIGIDAHKLRFFNREKSNVSYIVGKFPYVDICLRDAVTISSMSLGYFNSMVDEDEDRALDKIADKLSECSHLYIATTPALIDKLKPLFESNKLLHCNEVLEHSYPMYYFSNLGR